MEGADFTERLSEFLVVLPSFAHPIKIFLTDELAAGLAPVNGREQGLEVCRGFRAGAGGIFAVAQRVINRADEQGLNASGS